MNRLDDINEYEQRYAEWIAFFRANPVIFCALCLKISLKKFQRIWVHSIVASNGEVIIVANRGIGKTFIVALCAIIVAILYPNSRIVIVSGTQDQANKVIAKIEEEIEPLSEFIRNEIKGYGTITKGRRVMFKNNSTITALPSTDTALGTRSTFTIIEEYKLVSLQYFSKVVSPMAIPRQRYFEQVAKYREYKAEEHKNVFITSAMWKFEHVEKYFDNAVLDIKQELEANRKPLKRALCSDIWVSLKENLKTRQNIRETYKSTPEIAWLLEYENVALTENNEGFFNIRSMMECRQIESPFYPLNSVEYMDKMNNRLEKNHPIMPKQEGEIRIISLDIAIMAGAKNDSSVYMCWRLLPKGEHFIRSVVHIESHNGMSPSKQALTIKRLHEDFNADKVILDAKGIGKMVYIELAKITEDSERNKEYQAWSCYNDKSINDLGGYVPNSLNIVYAMLPSERKNSDMAMSLRNNLKTQVNGENKIKLLMTEESARSILEKNSKYNMDYGDMSNLNKLIKPFYETDFLISEIKQLTSYTNKGMIVVKERAGKRKDRYSSFLYGNFLADELEKQLLTYSSTEDNLEDLIMFI